LTADASRFRSASESFAASHICESISSKLCRVMFAKLFRCSLNLNSSKLACLVEKKGSGFRFFSKLFETLCGGASIATEPPNQLAHAHWRAHV
jgi:hypothetical protein